MEGSAFRPEERSLGLSNLQAAPGDHTHDGTTSKGGWTTYSSAWTAVTTNPTLGNGTIVSQYRTLGRVVDFEVIVTFGSTTSAGSGNYYLTIPLAAASHLPAGFCVGFATLKDSSSLAYRVHFPLLNAGGSDLRVLLYGATGTPASSAFPFTWAAGDQLLLNGRYEYNVNG